MKKFFLATIVGLVIGLVAACKDLPAANQPTNLIQPGIACAEEILLDLAGLSDPAAIVGACIKFGEVGVSDVVALAKTLLDQQPPPPVGAALSPLTVRLQKIAASGK